ncbi:MAG: M20 family metallopeptidase [Peptococcaceae bacterium]|nr:M20 family metallopeptidase [Peptococcaceae bacterium]
MLKALQECIKVRSLSGEEEGTRQVLQYFLELGQSLGFQAKNIDNLGGVIELNDKQNNGPDSGKTIGIIVHLDVVPEGSGWKHEPFAGQIEDGKVYGRGAIDNKGPAISALYAMKAVKESGLDRQAKIQMIIGLDEETVWDKTPKLLEKITEPDFSFVPDSVFPIVIAEKGLVWLELKKNFQPKPTPENSPQNAEPGLELKKIAGGDSPNIVPAYCEATLVIKKGQKADWQQKIKELIAKSQFQMDLTEKGQDLTIISHGKSAHAFACCEGRNAISQMVLFLTQAEMRNMLHLNEGQQQFLNLFAENIGLDHYGKTLGLACEDTLTGRLTINPGYLKLDQQSFTLGLDIRFPAGEQLDSIREKINSAFQCFQAEQIILDSLESLNFPEDNEHIQKLLKVYRDYTGDRKAKPLGMGGTTFAKAFKRAVAFGPTFPGKPKVEHQPDEYIEIEHLMQCAEIYALALKELAQVPRSPA